MKTYFKKEKGPFPACCCSFAHLLRVGTDKAPGPRLILGAHTLAKGTCSGTRMPRTSGRGAFSWISPCCSSLACPAVLPRLFLTPVESRLLQKGHKIRMPQAQPQAGMKGINPPQPALMGSVPSFTDLVNLQLPKTNPAEKEQPQTLFSPNPGH